MSRRAFISSVILTIAVVGQIILSFVLYKAEGHSAVRNAGWIILWASALFGLLPIITFRKWGGVARGQSYMKTTLLVDHGIYSIVRHPQYLAGILLGLALGLIAQHWLVILFGIVLVLTTYLDTFEEDRSCIEKFGQEYVRYMERVPRVNAVLGIMRLVRRKAA